MAGYEVRQVRNDASRQLADNHRTEWTAEEIAYLETHFVHARVADIAAHLGRTVEGVKQFHYDMKNGRRNADGTLAGAGRAAPVKRETQWDKGYTDLSALDREVDFSKLGW